MSPTDSTSNIIIDSNHQEADSKNIKKEKLRHIMEAASALTALNNEEASSETEQVNTITQLSPEKTNSETPNEAPEDHEEEEEEDDDEEGSSSQKKRFIPEHKKPDAALTFPEKLMSLMEFAEKQNEEEFCVAWLADGQSFVIRHPDEFTRKVLPKYFKATKFSSFTRKLYRWGFRQVNRGIGPDDPIIFGNEFFQREKAELMAKMRSVTAASARKQDLPPMATVGGAGVNMFGKRSLEDGVELDSKRMMLEQLLQHKAASMQGRSLYGSHFPGNMNMNLTNALRPQGGMDMSGLKPYDMLGQGGLSHNPLLSSFQMQHQAQQFGNPFSRHMGGNPGASSASSTADIVNAAIHALRFSS